MPRTKGAKDKQPRRRNIEACVSGLLSETVRVMARIEDLDWFRGHSPSDRGVIIASQRRQAQD